MKIIKESVKDENPIDTHYNALKCKLEALDKADADFKVSQSTKHSLFLCIFSRFLQVRVSENVYDAFLSRPRW